MSLKRTALAIVIALVQTHVAAAAPTTDADWRAVNAALDRKDPAEARRLAEALAATGDPEALNGLAVFVNQGIGGPPDPVRGRALLEKAAAAGSVGAKLNLAGILSQGDRGGYPRAIQLLQDVVADPRAGRLAYYPFGRMLVLGGDGKQDLITGVDYLKRAVAADPGNADAQFLVARAYQNGWGGTERSPEKAFEHFLAASKLGDERALRYVGMARLEGTGTTKDPVAALADLKLAADRGNVWAMLDVGVMLALGEGVAADPAQARSWYEKAARRGSAHGLRSLGAMLLQGDGGPADRVRGRAYLELAMEAGEPNAQAVAQELFRDPSPSERAAIDEAKTDWLKAAPKPTVD
jgi:uncharacterized protein